MISSNTCSDNKTQKNLGLAHYKWAEVRLVTCFDKVLKSPRLVFCTVTLHPNFVPKPEPMQGVVRSKDTKEKLFFRRIVMSAEHAVDWYSGLTENSKTPIPTTENERETHDGIAFLSPNLLNEMQWPSLGMPLSKSADLTGFKTFNPAPFIGEINSRIHRKFGDTAGFLHLVEDEKTVDFVERCVHINLAHYPEYLASVCLVVPNPLIQKVDNFLVRKENTEVVFHRFIARAGESLEGLKITLYEENNSLLTLVHTQNIPANGIVELERPKCMGKYSYQVMHEQYGLILQHQPTGFLRQVGLSLGVVEKQFEVTAPTSSKKNSAKNIYTSPQVTKADEVTVGADDVPHNFNGRIGQAAEHRRMLAMASEQNQKFFSAASREIAMIFIRNLISKAKHKVLIADPYFSKLQITQFLYAVSNVAVNIEIITSQLAFTGKAEERVGHAKALKAALYHAESETQRSIHAKVLIGEIALHDRFLVIDNNVWFMGNSLSDIGQRASMILKVPYPDEVINELVAIQETAIPLDEFINNHDSTRIKS